MMRYRWWVTPIAIILLLIVGTTWLVKRHDSVSPIEKDSWTVEDAHGDGEWMVVRNGKTHMTLHCRRSMEMQDGTMKHYSQCDTFKIGSVLLLERWDGGRTYIRKNTGGSEGENDYEVVDNN